MPIQLDQGDTIEREFPLPVAQDDDRDKVSITVNLDGMPFARYQSGRKSVFFLLDDYYDPGLYIGAIILDDS